MIEINNLTRISFPKILFQKTAKKILEKEGIQGKVEISVVLVEGDTIKGLNKRYRGKNQSTNVLAFPEDFFHKNKKTDKKARKFVLPLNNLLKLGEIVLCPAIIKKEAKQKKQSFKKEMLLVFIHGLLHLLGYDHQARKESIIMEAKQTGYLSLVK